MTTTTDKKMAGYTEAQHDKALSRLAMDSKSAVDWRKGCIVESCEASGGRFQVVSPNRGYWLYEGEWMGEGHPGTFGKFFTVEMTQRGVPEKMVDRLMRHKGKVEARYYKPSLKEMCEWSKKMPNLWPGNDFGKAAGVDNPGFNPIFPQVDLQTSGYTSTFITATPSPVQPDCTRPLVPGVLPTVSQPSGPGVGRGSSAVVGAAAPVGGKDRRGSSQGLQAENRHSPLDNAGLNELAEILEATGRLLRRLGNGSQQPNQHPHSRTGT